MGSSLLQPESVDQRVTLHGVTWEQYEAVLRMRGDGGGVRVAFLEGELELTSPSRNHEAIKTTIARLVEAWADASEVDLNGIGSWTLKEAAKARGIEPDECYVRGSARGRKVPDLAIEVVWTSGGLDKLEIYAGLGVREVWIWRKSALQVHVLRQGRYRLAKRSRLLPELDLPLLTRFVKPDNQAAAVRAYRAALALH